MPHFLVYKYILITTTIATIYIYICIYIYVYICIYICVYIYIFIYIIYIYIYIGYLYGFPVCHSLLPGHLLSACVAISRRGGDFWDGVKAFDGVYLHRQFGAASRTLPALDTRAGVVAVGHCLSRTRHYLAPLNGQLYWLAPEVENWKHKNGDILEDNNRIFRIFVSSRVPIQNDYTQKHAVEVECNLLV